MEMNRILYNYIDLPGEIKKKQSNDITSITVYLHEVLIKKYRFFFSELL